MLNHPKAEKLEKTIGKQTLEELEALSPEDLKRRITQASAAMKNAKDELEANPKYIDLKENLAALSSGKKEVDKRQKAIVQVCLILLDSQGDTDAAAGSSPTGEDNE